MTTSPRSRAKGAGSWLRKLMQCPSVALIDAGRGMATIEVAGVSGKATQLEGGLCIGVVLDIADAPEADWLNEVTLSLAATPEARDDGLQCDAGVWLLWHRYPHNIETKPLEEGLSLQLGMARRLAESAATDAGGPGQVIGKLI